MLRGGWRRVEDAGGHLRGAGAERFLVEIFGVGSCIINLIVVKDNIRIVTLLLLCLGIEGNS